MDLMNGLMNGGSRMLPQLAFVEYGWRQSRAALCRVTKEV
jgi:hypothetical protein